MVAIEENRSESEGKDGQTIIQPHPFLMDHVSFIHHIRDINSNDQSC
jgi:hypothetical protein